MTDETKEQEAEYYFIQFVFCSNPYLLQRKFRPLYDSMFDKYVPIFLEGREKHVDVMEINKKFKSTITAKN